MTKREGLPSAAESGARATLERIAPTPERAAAAREYRRRIEGPLDPDDLVTRECGGNSADFPPQVCGKVASVEVTVADSEQVRSVVEALVEEAGRYRCDLIHVMNLAFPAVNKPVTELDLAECAAALVKINGYVRQRLGPPFDGDEPAQEGGAS